MQNQNNTNFDQNSGSGVLTGKKVAILATDGFEEDELFEPKKALEAAGAEVKIISTKPGSIKAWKDGDWSKTIEVDEVLGTALANDYHAIMLPGGVINADKIRSQKLAIDFIQGIIDAHKPVAAICHAAWSLIETGEVKHKTMTSWPSLKTDLRNAGAVWVDAEVIVDQNWVTSRKPDDLPAFNRKMIELFAQTNVGQNTHSGLFSSPSVAKKMTIDGPPSTMTS